MSGDVKKKKFDCDYVINRSGNVHTYIQLKHYGANSSRIDEEWRRRFLQEIKIHGNGEPLSVKALIDLNIAPPLIKLAPNELEESAFKAYRAHWINLAHGSLSPVTPIIERPPGHHLINLLQKVMPKSVFERVYGQMIADSREEFYEALSQGDPTEAKKIRRQLNLDLIMSVVSYIAGLPAHLLVKPFKLFDKGE